MAKQHDLVIKILLLGDSGVGKTCMIRRFTEDTYSSAQPETIGEIMPWRKSGVP